MTKHEILQKLMERLHAGDDPKEVLFDLLLELDEWLGENGDAFSTSRAMKQAVKRV